MMPITYNHEFDTRRTECPECGARRGFAALKRTEGGKCHACNKFIPPTAPLGTTTPGNKAPRQRNRKVKTYDYTDEQGVALYHADRFEYDEQGNDGQTERRKDFRLRPAGGKATAGGMKGVRRVLYGLPSVVEAVREGWPVVIVEGEKDADTYNGVFAKTGFQAVATTSVQGASSWRTYATGYGESLRGAHVILDGDCDERGAMYMRHVAASLEGVAADVRFTTEARQAIAGEFLGPKDITDRVEAGMTSEQVVERLRLSQPVGDVIVNVVNVVNGVEKSRGTSLIIRDAVEILSTDYPPPVWIIEGLIPCGLSVLGGRPKHGKSWLALNLAVAVATGGLLFGKYRATRGRVLYLALEDSVIRVKNRLEQFTVAEGIVIPPGSIDFAFGCPTLDNGGMKVFEDLAASDNYRLIILDTYGRVQGKRSGRGGYIEDYGEWSDVHDLVKDRNTALLPLTHTGKMSYADPFDSIQGTTGVTASADSLYVLLREPDGTSTLRARGRDIDEQAVALSFDKTRGAWSALGDADVVHQSEQRRMILSAFADGEVLTPKQIADRSGLPYDSVRQLVGRIVQNGSLERAKRGKYRIPVHNVHNVHNDDESGDIDENCEAYAGSAVHNDDAFLIL